jgi:hypothetical protein
MREAAQQDREQPAKATYNHDELLAITGVRSSLLLEQFPKMVLYDLLWFDKFIPWQVGETRPTIRRGSADDLVDHIKLVYLIITLEDRFLGEQF